MKGFLADNSSDMCTRVAPVFTAMGDDILKFNWLFTDMSGWDSIISRYDHKNGKDYFFVRGEEMRKLMAENRLATMNWGVISGFPADVDLDDILKEELPYADWNKDLWTAPIKPMHSLATFQVVVTDITKMAVMAEDDALADRIREKFSRSVDLEEYCTRMMRKREKQIEKEAKEEKKGGFFKRLFG